MVKTTQIMSLKERVQEVFNRFNVELTVSEETAPETNLAEAPLANGTVIYTDAESFEEGAEVYIINDEGERIPLPPGDYELEDGRVMVIGEGGALQSVADAPAEQSEEDKEELSEVNPEAPKQEAAAPGLKRTAPAQVEPEPINLKNLSPQERVAALLKQFSS